MPHMHCRKEVGVKTLTWSILWVLILAPSAAWAQRIRVDPVGVNVNATGATTVFLTFGGVTDYQAADATWCGALIPAAPDFGNKCDPATIFGSLPARLNLSTPSGAGGLTDIMSIPPSVSRRAFQAAQRGEDSAFFYVRRFINRRGGRDEYVVVTCRMAGGGARSPFALTEVTLSFDSDAPVLSLERGETLPTVKAQITYNGTGRLQGRWEVVMPGDDPPEARDLFTEATLPIEERGSQRRYTQLTRFNEFLPPVGRFVLRGPDPSRLPTAAEGMYLLLLRIEASDDREADSNLAAAGAGSGIVHSGAVAGFPLPALRYFVGSGASVGNMDLRLILPPDGATVAADQSLLFTWTEVAGVAVYRFELGDAQHNEILSAVLPPGVIAYRPPSWLKEKAGGGQLHWRVVALDSSGAALRETPWRRLALQ